MPTAMAAADVVVCRAELGPRRAKLAVVGRAERARAVVGRGGGPPDGQRERARRRRRGGAGPRRASSTRRASAVGARVVARTTRRGSTPWRGDAQDLARPDAARAGRRAGRGAGPWLTVRRSTSPVRRWRIHVVGIGGAGMSAIATVLAAMGHRVSGSDLKDSAGLDRLRAARRRRARRPRRRQRRRRRRGRRLHRHPGHATPRSWRRRSAASPCCGGPRSSPRSPRPGAASPSAGTHGKTTTSSMLALVLVEAGLHPSFIIGGEVNEIGTGAVWDGRATCSSSRPTRATARSSSCPRKPCSSPTSSRTTSSTTARFDAPARPRSTGSSPSARAARRLRRRPARRRARPRPRRGRATASSDDGRLPDGRRDDRTRAACTFALARRDGAAWPVALPVPGLHNARNAAGGGGDGAGARRGFEAAVRRARPVRRGGPPLRAPRRGRRRHLRRRLRPPAERGRGGHRSGRSEGDWRGSCASSSPTATAAPPRSGRTSPTRSIGADVLVVTDVYAAGEAPRPGVTGKLIVERRARRTIRGSGSPSCRTGPTSSTYLAAELRPGDLCLTLGAGDLTSLARRAPRAARGDAG